MNIHKFDGGAVSGTLVGGTDGIRDATSTDSDGCRDEMSSDDGFTSTLAHMNGIGLPVRDVDRSARLCDG